MNVNIVYVVTIMRLQHLQEDFTRLLLKETNVFIHYFAVRIVQLILLGNFEYKSLDESRICTKLKP